jgi:GT2 family glycosyltransferase
MQRPVGADPQPVASVVLCVRNGADTLARQLDALSAQDFAGPWEIVLVDNGSTDGTGALASSWSSKLPGLRVVEEPRPGLNRARNRGVGVARADRILCCDADDEAGPAWVGAMVPALGRFDIVGGALEPYPNVVRAGRWFECPQSSGLPTLFDQTYAVGANLGFSRRVFDAIGGFDEGFGTGADEVDFCLRARRAGFSIGFAPDAVARYRMKESTGAVMRQRFGYGRGHQRLLAKYHRRAWVDRPRPDRWHEVARNAGSLVRTSPRLLRADTRLGYLARLAHVSGEVTELVRPRALR